MIAVHCDPTCQVTQLVAGDKAHGEGHLLVVGTGPAPTPKALPQASDLGRAALVRKLLLWLAAAVIGAIALTAAGVLVILGRRGSPGGRT